MARVGQIQVLLYRFLLRDPSLDEINLVLEDENLLDPSPSPFSASVKSLFGSESIISYFVFK